MNVCRRAARVAKRYNQLILEERVWTETLAAAAHAGQPIASHARRSREAISWELLTGRAAIRTMWPAYGTLREAAGSGRGAAAAAEASRLRGRGGSAAEGR